jgi:hypothetical protein
MLGTLFPAFFFVESHLRGKFRKILIREKPQVDTAQKFRPGVLSELFGVGKKTGKRGALISL